MDINVASAALSALAEPTRLSVYRRLVEAGPDGLCVTELLEAISLSQPTLSFHLKALTTAGLLKRRKQGRHVYYSPAFEVMQALMVFLMENCCQGQQCLDDLNPCLPQFDTRASTSDQ